MIELYYTYDKQTLIVNQKGISTTRFSALPEYPRDALLVKPLEPKNGYVVRVCNFEHGRPKDTEYIVDHRGKTIYNKENSTQSKSAEKLGEVKEGWTLTEPPHRYVTWDEAQNDWQNDIEKRRAAKNAEIKAWRDSQENSSDLIITVDGIDWNADPAARDRIRNALASTFVSPFWTDANNEDQTEFDLQKIFNAIVERGAKIHQRKREMNQFIEMCEVFEDIDEFQVKIVT